MAGDFSQVAQKMRWANLQLTRLNFAVTQYVEGEPYVTRIEDKPELQGYTATAQLRNPPPPELALRAGDFLNNTQGALDYLAWQLVRREDKVPGSKTSFPIELPNEDGSEPSVQILDRREKPAIEDQQVLDALAAVQPYKDGDGARDHPLYVLRVLNREAKHRHLPLLIASIPSFQMDLGTFGLPEQIPAFDEKRLKDGEQVSFVPYSKTPEGRPPKAMKLHALVALEQIGNPPQAGLWEGLVSIHNRVVEDVLPRFQPLF